MTRLHYGSGIPHQPAGLEWKTTSLGTKGGMHHSRWQPPMETGKDEWHMNGFKGTSWPETMFSPSNVGCPAHFPIKCIQTLGDALTKLEAMGTSSSNIGDVPL